MDFTIELHNGYINVKIKLLLKHFIIKRLITLR